MTVAVGTRLGPYLVTARLGEGGMGEVWRATDTRLERDVALKVLPAAFARDPKRLERFEREARAVAALDHPNVVTIHAVGEAEGVRFLVMELVRGETLDARIPPRGMPLPELLALALPIADALAAAHEKGVVHRDLKPSNVMLTPDGRPKVLDFGLAKLAGAEAADPESSHLSTLARTEAGVVLGTVPYMSPEQVEGKPVDHRSDLFSLGVLLYEMATGRRPFGGGSAPALMSAILRDTPAPLTSPRPDLPEPLARLVARCLEKRPDDRYQTAREVRAALDALRRQPATGVAPAAVASAPAASEPPALVVLPFVNLSPDPQNEFFSDGLTEEIITDLSKVRGLRVISRTSAMQLKGARKDVRTIGRELGVRYVLEGGVRRAGTSLRITAQLIDARTETQLWAEKFSGTLDDVFEVQESVSRQIVRALDVTLTSDDDRRLAERPIASARAFELYLQARHEARRMGGDALDRAERLLAEALAIEGETAPLLALQAWIRVTRFRIGVDRSAACLAEAEARAHSILARAPDSPAAHALLGFVAYERGLLPDAIRSFDLSLAREPNDADVLFFTGIVYVAAGEAERALATGRRLVACDPLSPLAWILEGAAGWFVGRFEESHAELARAVELDPGSFMLRWTAGYGCALMGRLDEAAGHAEFLRQSAPDVPYTRQLLALLAGIEGRAKEARELLAPVDVDPLDAHNKFHLAESFGLAGETERALDVLAQAVEGGFHPPGFMAVHCPFLAPLRPLAGFAALLARARERTEEFRRALRSVADATP